ncbi:MAG TPA: glycosyl transferase family protein [Magnetospirillaceae bacterium]|jgi:anthranilate phosphoribosyltransferase
MNMASIEEHPFAQFVRALGKGPQLARHLTEDEAREAGRMIMRNDIEPIQLGAFLCLMRVMGETPEELAGLVMAAREVLHRPAGAPTADIDWPAYAGKKNRLPWFVLTALLLAGAGIRVAMHGGAEHTAGRLFTESAIAALGIAPARSMDEAAAQLTSHCFTYVPLDVISARLGELLTLKPIIGLRSPFHTVAKALNPFDAACQMIGVAHPPYRPLHQTTGLLVRQARMAVFKGDGGEAERRPEKPLDVALVNGLSMTEETWPPLLNVASLPHEDPADLDRLRGVWNGTVSDSVAETMVTGTAAIALKAMGRATTQDEAQVLAETFWHERDKDALRGAA